MYFDGQPLDTRHNPVDSAANIERVFARFEVNVACIEIKRTREEMINQTNDRRFRGKVF